MIKLKEKSIQQKAKKIIETRMIKLENIIYERLGLKDEIENIQNFYKRVINKK
jgi:hypothetical protein